MRLRNHEFKISYLLNREKYWDYGVLSNDIRKNGVPDLDQVYQSHFAKKIRHQQRLKEEFRKCFRIQYWVIYLDELNPEIVLHL